MTIEYLNTIDLSQKPSYLCYLLTICVTCWSSTTPNPSCMVPLLLHIWIADSAKMEDNLFHALTQQVYMKELIY